MASTTINSITTVIAQSLGIPADTLLAWLASQIGAGMQKGTATLVAGTVTVSGVTLTSGSQILFGYNTAGADADYLDAPVASRNVSAGTFVINSSNALDTSSVDWIIVG